jgi:hypothetical protein
MRKNDRKGPGIMTVSALGEEASSRADLLDTESRPVAGLASAPRTSSTIPERRKNKRRKGYLMMRPSTDLSEAVPTQSSLGRRVYSSGLT